MTDAVETGVHGTIASREATCSSATSGRSWFRPLRKNRACSKETRDKIIMKTSRFFVSLLAVTGPMLLTSFAIASDPQNALQRDLETSRSASAATVETIRKAAVRNIAARYNLNELQAKLTDELMEREVYRFLAEHEETVWPMIRDLLACQLGANPPGIEKSRQIGKSALPIIAEVKKAIFQANDEWRTILSDEQKTMHDWDLSEMEKQFQKINKNMQSWANGTPNSDGLFPPQDMAGSPRRPKLPADGWLPGGSPTDMRVAQHTKEKTQPRIEPKVEMFHPDVFEKFVEEFIKDYNLDEGQIDSARSILTEYKGKAALFYKKSAAQLTSLENQERQAQRPFDRKAVAKIRQQRKQLWQPIYDLFAQMEARLKALLNRTQLAQYNEKQPATPTFENQHKKPSKKKTAKAKADKTTREPATD